MKSELFKAWFKLPLLQMSIWYSNFEAVRDNLLYMILKLKREEKKTHKNIVKDWFLKKLGHLLWNFDTNPRTLYSI